MHTGTYKTKEDSEQIVVKDINGVNAVLGSHPHVLQPMEIKTVQDVYGIKKERFVIYSQGNIVANMPNRYKNSGIIINLNIRKDENGTEIDSVEYIPTIVDSYCISNNGRSAFEILPMFSEGDYLNHQENNIIKQSFNDSTTILKSSSSKITLKTKE